jgi:prevent-host-death family protein
MLHMERIGVRELRQNASRYLKRVEAGESFEVSDRGRPVARIVPVAPSGWQRLVAEGRVRLAEGDLLDIEPLPLPPGATAPSEVLARMREHER